MFKTTPVLLTLFLAVGCATPGSPAIVDSDDVLRAPLLAAVSSLEGKWQGEGPDGEPKITEFAVIAAGSAVRENMLLGEPEEMTNMYTLDGNSLVMTHYCAGGNQPRMRADSVRDGRIVFTADGVADLGSADEVYMGAMTLVLVDENHIEQHWQALKNGQPDSEMLIAMTRVE